MRAGWSRRRLAKPDTAIQRPLLLLQPWAQLITMFTLVPLPWAFDRCAENITGNIREAASHLEKEKLLKQLLKPSIRHRPVICGRACAICAVTVSHCVNFTDKHRLPFEISVSQAPPQKDCPHIITYSFFFMFAIPNCTHSFIMNDRVCKRQRPVNKETLQHSHLLHPFK